jgi:hypothetical protein
VFLFQAKIGTRYIDLFRVSFNEMADIVGLNRGPAAPLAAAPAAAPVAMMDPAAYTQSMSHSLVLWCTHGEADGIGLRLMTRV